MARAKNKAGMAPLVIIGAPRLVRVGCSKGHRRYPRISTAAIGVAGRKIAWATNTRLVHVTSERLPHTYAPSMVTDDWLIRFDGGTGEMLWIEKVNRGLSMAIDSAGNIVLAWPTVLQKLDAMGSLLWSIPRTAQQAFETAWVATDGDGNIVVARTELDGDPSRIGP